MSLQDHQDLADVLRGCRKWVLTLDDCPQERHMYRLAKITTLRVQYQSRRSRERVGQTELVIDNLDSVSGLG